MTEWNHRIPNEALVPTDVPERGASWHELCRFASTFNAWIHYEEPWAHSDWSEGIPIEEYQEAVRRRGLPRRATEVFDAVQRRYDASGQWVGTVTELRAYLFMLWRFLHDDPVGPGNLNTYYDLCDVIRAAIARGETA